MSTTSFGLTRTVSLRPSSLSSSSCEMPSSGAWPRRTVALVPPVGITTGGTSATVRLGHAPADGISHEPDGTELRLKDTVRVNPHEVVHIVVRFDVLCRRYVDHLHLPGPQAP